MRVGKTKELLVEQIKARIPLLVQHNGILDEIAIQLNKYNISLGNIIELINDHNKLIEAQLEELLFAW
ncbi:hypothetical protein [Lysinibacillus pakistanensis]|uniref:hypothetical protein n=1 Tax=Lysinibacillus pakistanensis TaxID=759811 RepID=UPI003D28C076